jgi:hypothetical protein
MTQNLKDALEYADSVHKRGLLVWDEIPELPDDEMASWWSTPYGERETIYSIASLYCSKSIGGELTTEDEIIEELMKLYPKYY